VGNWGGNPPANFVPQAPACSYAAASFLQESVTAIRVNQVEIEDIVYGNADPEVVYTLLYILLETEFEPAVSSVFPAPAFGGDYNIIPHVEMGSLVTVLGQMSCWLGDGFVARFWEVEADGITGFMAETLTWVDPVDLSHFWDVEEQSDPQNTLSTPDDPILVGGITLRLLKPYVEVDPTPIDTASDISAGENPFPTPCEHGAPSRLAVGMQAEMAGPTYMKFPTGAGIAGDGLDDGYSGMMLDAWDLKGIELPLDDYGFAIYADLNNTIPVYQHPWIDLEGNAVMIDKATIYDPPLYQTQTVTIVGGPICSPVDNRYLEPDGIVEYDPAVTSTERFFTMWQISLEVDGQTYGGWYPESVADYVWWLFEEGDTDRTHYLYFLQPISQNRSKACAELPWATFSSGARVQPVFGTMNLRERPEGNLIGEVAPTQNLTLVGEAVCQGGVNWWQTNLGGWIAENNPDSSRYVLLLRPADPLTEDSPSSNSLATQEAAPDNTSATAEPSSPATPDPTGGGGGTRPGN
jgi:hypothetical protein